GAIDFGGGPAAAMVSAVGRGAPTTVYLSPAQAGRSATVMACVTGSKLTGSEVPLICSRPATSGMAWPWVSWSVILTTMSPGTALNLVPGMVAGGCKRLS